MSKSSNALSGNQKGISPLGKCLYGQVPHPKLHRWRADTSLWSSSGWVIGTYSWTSHSQRSIKERWVNQAEPLLTAAVFTRSICCQSCQSTSRSQSSLGDRKKNILLMQQQRKKKCSCLHELWLIFFTGGKAVNSLKKKKEKLKVLLLLWTLESSFWKICFFFVMDQNFFFIGKKCLLVGKMKCLSILDLQMWK